MAKVTIYQLNDENANKEFRSYDSIVKHFGPVDMGWYNEVYAMDMDIDKSKGYTGPLEELYCTFNIDRPEDFYGHSLSMSDVVIIDDRKFMCDRFGWRGFE